MKCKTFIIKCAHQTVDFEESGMV
ncbi:uncharacterized protein METZ01_LOCUS68372 [marine metagenome]|uniref:Uncharacterized protein n=1 Tax=marine metagenome TaxID=408172 RepID=A0A381TJ01_9ZZZZ